MVNNNSAPRMIQPTSADWEMFVGTVGEEHCRMKLEIIVLNRLLLEHAAQIGELTKLKDEAKS